MYCHLKKAATLIRSNSIFHRLYWDAPNIATAVKQLESQGEKRGELKQMKLAMMMGVKFEALGDFFWIFLDSFWDFAYIHRTLSPGVWPEFGTWNAPPPGIFGIFSLGADPQNRYFPITPNLSVRGQICDGQIAEVLLHRPNIHPYYPELTPCLFPPTLLATPTASQRVQCIAADLIWRCQR